MESRNTQSIKQSEVEITNVCEFESLNIKEITKLNNMIEIIGNKGKLNIVFGLIHIDQNTTVFSYNEDIPINNSYTVTVDSVKEFGTQVINTLIENKNYNSTVILYTNINDLAKIGILKDYASRIEEVEKLANQVVVMHK